MRRHHLRQFVFITLLSLYLAGSVNANPAGKDEIEQVIAAIGSGPAADLKSRLLADRLTVLDAAFRARAINALPAALRNQRLTEGQPLRRAEMNLQRVLALHERPEFATVEIFLLRDETAQAMLWRGCVLALSAGLVNALSDMDTDPFYHPELDERSRFIRAMSELAQQKANET